MALFSGITTIFHKLTGADGEAYSTASLNPEANAAFSNSEVAAATAGLEDFFTRNAHFIECQPSLESKFALLISDMQNLLKDGNTLDSEQKRTGFADLLTTFSGLDETNKGHFVDTLKSLSQEIRQIGENNAVAYGAFPDFASSLKTEMARVINPELSVSELGQDVKAEISGIRQALGSLLSHGLTEATNIQAQAGIGLRGGSLGRG